MNRVMIGIQCINEMEKEVSRIRKNLKVSQDRHKSYANKNKLHREFNFADHVPRRISLKIGSCAKISPRYCGPFKVLERIGPIAYKISLHAKTRYHNGFYVSFLKKYVVHDPNHVIDWDVILVEP